MTDDRSFYVYMLASKRNGTLYIGMTSNLPQRMWHHTEGLIEGFAKKYHVNQLVWYERHETAESAIKRERNMKEWKRAWKIELIEAGNPLWHDLYPNLARRVNR